MADDYEPVFKRSKWRNRYYYNPRNPIGLALIIISLVFTATLLILMANRAGPFKPPEQPSWSPPPVDHMWPPPSGAPVPAPSTWPPG